MDYRGEIGIILINNDPFTPFVINQGDRIAQMIIAKHETCEFVLVDNLDNTERADGGFGHSDIK